MEIAAGGIHASHRSFVRLQKKKAVDRNTVTIGYADIDEKQITFHLINPTFKLYRAKNISSLVSLRFLHQQN